MKHTFSRRLFALVLTLALALSLVVPAWAAPGDSTFTVSLTAGEGFPNGTVGTAANPGVLYDGAGGQLTATVTPQENTNTVTIDQFKHNVAWTSDTPSVATVTGSGDNAGVKAASKGTATITATVTASWTETHIERTTAATSDKDEDQTNDSTGVRTIVTISGTTKTITTITPRNDTKTTDFTVKVEPVAVTEVRVSPTTMSLAVDTSRTLSATVYPGNATNTGVKWESDTPAVATVDQNGKVTGVAEGTANITVTTDGTDADGNKKFASCVVTVTEKVIAATGVTLKQNSLEVQAGKTATLEATVLPENATNKTVTWTSSNSTIATVNRDGVVTGVVTGVKAGTATITASTPDGRYSASCSVTVTAATAGAVTISSGRYTDQSPLCLDIGKAPVRLIASVQASGGGGGADQSVTWKSGDEKIAKVDSQGNVTAVGVGKTTITATSVSNSAISGSCPVEVSGVMVSGFSTTMSLNQSTPVKLDTLGNAKSNLKKSWVSSNPAVASVDGTDKILARGIGSATITLSCTASDGTRYPVEPSSFTVTVVENTGSIYYGSATAGAPYEFSDIMTELNRICRNSTEGGYGLSYINNVQVPTSEGVLYYNHVSSDDTGFGVGATERYYYSESTVGERYMSGLTFVPNSEFNGETTITFTGYSTQGERYNGKIRLTVTGSGNVTFITKAGEAVVLSSTGFTAASRSETGREISSVSFELPQASRGTLYYGYTGDGQYRYAVTEGETYFRSRTPYIDQVSFLPAEYYIGTLTLPFHGTDTAGSSFTGRLHIIVVPNRPDGERKELTTTALLGTTVDFDKFDFQAACQAALGQSLSYVRFTPPSSSAGTLYYNYTSSGRYDGLVNANTRYYPSRSPRISDVTFVPAYNRVAPVTIDFVGYSTSGRSFDGTVTIYYRDTNSGDDVITYAVSSGQAIPFEPADFTALCQSVTGKDLSRIVFQYLPSSSEGTLYYNYNSGSSTGTRVTTSTNLYRSSLSGVAFAPKSDFIGTVDLEFNGYTTDGTRFTGLVRIEVEEGNTTLRYSVSSGSSVSFDGDDFNNICRQATDNKLNYVRFQLPKSSEGKLYYRTSSSSTSKNSVSASSSYYYTTSGSNKLDNVFFTAASNFTGTVSIDYTGFSTSGARFTGTVQIDVSYHRGTVLSYAADALPFTIPGSDLTSACNSALERSLSYIVINSLPSAEEGRLYYDYVGQGTGTEVKTSTKYYPDKSPYLDRLVFVPKAGYEGTVSLPYTGYDTRGDAISGSVEITVTQATTSVFSDMSRHVWAIPSVDFLYSSGVVKGTGSNRFDPVSDVRRCDFVLMLSRMYNLPAAGTKSFDDVPEDAYYAAAIASAKSQNVVTGENGLFRPEEPITREDAMVFLYNAMRAAKQSVPAGSSSELYAFADYNSVSAGARNAVISMIHMGILKGDDYRRINPGSPITRAETAAFLHRAMTL